MEDLHVEVKKGFGALSPEQRSEMGRRGGLAAQAAGKGRRFTSVTAALAAAKVNHKRNPPPSSGAPATI